MSSGPNEKNSEENPIQGMGESLLIIGDEERAVKSIASFLALYDYQVMTASSDREALMLSKEIKTVPALSIIDINQNGKKYLQLSGLLNEIHPEMKIIILSGYRDSSLVDNEDCINHLLKPLHPFKLLKEVRRILDKPQEIAGQPSVELNRP